jgi:hypothetical protein
MQSRRPLLIEQRQNVHISQLRAMLNFSRLDKKMEPVVSAEEVRARWAYSELLSDRPYNDPSVQELNPLKTSRQKSTAY